METIEHKEEGLTLKACYGRREEALKRNGVPLSYLIGEIKITASQSFYTDYIHELGANMIEDAREKFIANTTEEDIQRYIEGAQKYIKTSTQTILSEIAERKFINELTKMDGAELAELINSFGIFTAYNRPDSKISVSTEKTLSKASWNRCRKLNGGKYLAKVNFDIDAGVADVYEIIDISRKTSKFSQEKLQSMKNDRLSRKHSPKPQKTTFSEWYKEADMPEKINGVWVDLETGLRYSDYK